MILPTSSENLHLQPTVSRYVSRAAKQPPSAMARQHLGAQDSTFEKLRNNINSPPLCTLANPSFHSSSPSISHSHLVRVSFALQLALFNAPAQPVLKILLSLHTHQLPHHNSLDHQLYAPVVWFIIDHHLRSRRL